VNPLTSLLLIANPVITALLTLVVFLESKKQKALLETIEKTIIANSKEIIGAVENQKEGFDAIRLSLKAISEDQGQKVLLETIEKSIIANSRQIIEAVENQKEGFDTIGSSLKAISEDQGRSVETFTGISNALTTSSTTNQQSLNNVVSALNALSVKTDETMTNLLQGINASNNDMKANLKTAYNEATDAIREVATKMEEEYSRLSNVVKQCEKGTMDAVENSIKAQKELHKELSESIRTDAETLKASLDSNSRELSTINVTLKNAVSI
jgi:hypothetical protein